MTANVELVDPKRIQPNPDNPRVIFREDELAELEASIASQGILVPLSIYPERAGYVLLDGERRWRCASRLGLHRVPAIIQSKPNRITNIMMMFAIHNARKDWDPLPTAIKLQELEDQLAKAKGAKPKEGELAAAASLSRGEVRRFKKILKIPDVLKIELMGELKKPKSEQQISLDQVLESTVAAERLVKAGIIAPNRQLNASRTIVRKFRDKVIDNTTAPRKISKILQFMDADAISKPLVISEINRFLSDASVSIDSLYSRTVQAEETFQSLEQVAKKLLSQIHQTGSLIDDAPESLTRTLIELRDALNKLGSLR